LYLKLLLQRRGVKNYPLDNDDQGDSEDDDDTESDELPKPKKSRSLFYHPSSSCGIVALDISIFSLLSNIWSCFYIHVLHFIPKFKYHMASLLKYLPFLFFQYSKKTIYSKKTTKPTLPPGSRSSKRVRAAPQAEE
jgi:hypothetical protein